MKTKKPDKSQSTQNQNSKLKTNLSKRDCVKDKVRCDSHLDCLNQCSADFDTMFECNNKTCMPASAFGADGTHASAGSQHQLADLKPQSNSLQTPLIQPTQHETFHSINRFIISSGRMQSLQRVNICADFFHGENCEHLNPMFCSEGTIVYANSANGNVVPQCVCAHADVLHHMYINPYMSRIPVCVSAQASIILGRMNLHNYT